MSNLALLVDCHKIINWLEDRKKLRKDWYNYLKAGEEKLKLLLKDHEWTIAYPAIHSYLNENEQTFNYNDLLEVVELLLQTDLAQQKSLLFGYSDKRVKQWTTLKKYMTGNNLDLLSLAKFIEQSLRFDLPGLNKAIQGLDNQLATLKRKIDFNNNTIFQERAGLLKERTLLDINSEEQQNLAIQRLIEGLVAKGPSQITEFQAMLREQNFKRYLNEYNQINQRNETPNQLETLQFFMQNGDQFQEIFKDSSKRDAYTQVKKYEEFENWKGSNQWQIMIEGEEKQQRVKVNLSTVIQDREFRQHLLYDLNQLLFFFKGVKHELNTAQKGLGLDSEKDKGSSIVLGQAETAIKQIETAIAYMKSKRLITPLQLKNSKKAYQLIVSQFLGYEANIRTMKQQIVIYQEQIIDLQRKRQKQVQKLNRLRRKVANCKPKCESYLSQIVKRDVKITGQINKLE